MIYHFLDWFFVIFHTLLIFFNLFGWICKATRKANLITLLLTGSSWFILGIFYGIGYCPLTDWHWQVLHKLGKSGMPVSYIKYLADRITGLDFDAGLVNTLTVAGFFLALILSLFFNFRKRFARLVSGK